MDNVDYQNRSEDDFRNQYIVGESVEHPDEEGTENPTAMNDDTESKMSNRKTMFLTTALLLVVISTLVILIVLVPVVWTPDDHDSGPTTSAGTSPNDDSEEVAKDWILVLEIEGSTDSFGFGVDLNTDTTVSPKANNGRGQMEVHKSPVPNKEGSDVWERLGDATVGYREGDEASLGMDLSPNGSHLVVGYPGNDHGFVRVFRFDNGEWKQQGQTLTGPSWMSQFGTIVAINNNGTCLVVGAPLGGDNEEGVIQAYYWQSDDSNNSVSMEMLGMAIVSVARLG